MLRSFVINNNTAKIAQETSRNLIQVNNRTSVNTKNLLNIAKNISSHKYGKHITSFINN